MAWHGAFIGQTGNGKTFAAQLSAARYKAAGIGVLVLHKPNEIWPAHCADWQTSDPEAFLWKYERARSCACFMELADAHVDKWDERFHYPFTDGRHKGHRCFYLTQRGARVHPDIRENCSLLWLFACGRSAAKVWAEEFDDPELLKAAKLLPHQCLFKPNRRDPARHLILTP